MIYATLFGAKHAATVIAFMRFIDFIMMKGRIYSSAVCIEFALAMFEINTPTRHDPTVWSNFDEDWVREYFHEDARKNKRYAEAHPAAPSGRRLQPPSATLTTNDRPWDSPELDKSFCYSYNNFQRGCKFGKDCKMKHMCHKCKDRPHPQMSCASTK